MSAIPTTKNSNAPAVAGTLAPETADPQSSSRRSGRELGLEELMADVLIRPRSDSTYPGDHERVPDTEAMPKLPGPGDRVGRYSVFEVLGRGGMGLVLRARDELLQRDVAIKVILPHYLGSDPTAGLRFLREAEIVAKLNHPNIISVLDAGLDSGVAFLAFGFAPGKSFSELRNEGRLPLKKAADLLLPIVSATAYAHALGIVHGDIKPTNLILGTNYRGAPHPWVLDFGVSFFAGLDAGLDPTRGKITGTPGYLAPEWLGNVEIDGRADCFSLGCVLYELMAGSGPFAECQRLSQAFEYASQRKYNSLSRVVECPKELDALVWRALAPERTERFQTARELGQALLPFASDALRAYYEEEFESTSGPS